MWVSVVPAVILNLPPTNLDMDWTNSTVCEFFWESQLNYDGNFTGSGPTCCRRTVSQ